MTLSELNVAIIKWAEDRQILKHSSAYAQAFKTAEEVMELVEATAKHSTGNVPGHNDYSDDIRDAIGDIYVTLVVGAGCFNNGKVEIPDVFIQELPDPVAHMQKMLITIGATSGKSRNMHLFSILESIGTLDQIAEKYDTTLEACVNQAYNTIKGRTGKMGLNGIWEKDQ